MNDIKDFRALESMLVCGMIENLPARGAYFPAEKRAAWLALMDSVLQMEYEESKPPGPAGLVLSRWEDPAVSPGLEDGGAPVVMETRVRPTPAGVAFAERLQKRGRKPGAKKERGPKALAPVKALPAARAGVEKRKRKRPDTGKLSARDVILYELKRNAGPMSVKQIAAAALADTSRDVSHFNDLRGAIGFQLPRMERDGEVVLADVSGLAHLYALKKA